MSKTIMVVDDSESIRRVLKMALSLDGEEYEVVECCDGLEAVDALKDQKFNLIISDLNMPNMDGLAFARHVKACPEHRFTPIIMLTTEFGEDRKTEGMQAGIKAWLVKPFKADQLQNAVTKLIR